MIGTYTIKEWTGQKIVKFKHFSSGFLSIHWQLFLSSSFSDRIDVKHKLGGAELHSFQLCWNMKGEYSKLIYQICWQYINGNSA